VRGLAIIAAGGIAAGACGGSGTSTTPAAVDAGADARTAADAAPADAGPGATAKFSFFVTSYRAIVEQSGSAQGFGGDLRAGETGPGAGLRGADKICARIAEKSFPGAGTKTWRAFLSATAGEDGKQVDAIDRIGSGPWYDRLGRVLATSKADLLHDRPLGADPAIVNDLPNEDGVPNKTPEAGKGPADNHHMLTGTTGAGKLYGASATCLDWTSAKGDLATEGRPRVGLSFPRSGPPDAGAPPDGGLPPPVDGGAPGGSSSSHWIDAMIESGCAPGVVLVPTPNPPPPGTVTVGSGGGYGGFYCFALTP
jgi:hypothetical protein